MTALNLHVSPTVRWVLKDVFEAKGLTCINFSMSDPYFLVSIKQFRTFKEAKGRSLITIRPKHIAEIQLIPAEALIEYLKSIE